MRRKNFSSRFRALPAEKKILAVASLVTLVSCFLPWYGINSRVINEWWNAFSSIGSVAGYLVSAFSLISLVLLMAPVVKPELDLSKKLPIKETSMLIFLNAQSLFVTLIFIPVYAQYSLINATNSGTRFGIYIALISTLVSAVAALSYQRRAEKLANRLQEFAQVPRAHRAVDEWNQEESFDDQPAQEDSLVEDEQETIFMENQEEEQYPKTMMEDESVSSYQQPK